MKKILILLSIIIPLFIIQSAYAALSGYTYNKKIIIAGSSAAATPSTFVQPIRVSPNADPVETGSWTVNGTVFTTRLPIPVTEVTGAALTSYPLMVEVNTLVLKARGLLTNSDGVEFSDGTNVLPYYVFSSEFNKLRTRYYPVITLTANQSITLYMYLSPSTSLRSTNSKTMAQTFTAYTYSSRTTSSLSDVRYSTTATNIDYCGLCAGHTGCTNSFGNDVTQSVLHSSVSLFGNTTYYCEESGFHFTDINLHSNFDNTYIAGYGTATLTVTSASGWGYDQGTNLSTEIVVETADNASIFSTKADYEARVKSSTAVAWNITSAWTNGATYTSPDIMSLLNSYNFSDQTKNSPLVRSGWVSGNSINLYWRKTSACALAQRRVIETYKSDPAKSALLTFTVYLHPDYKKMPQVKVPVLAVADVFLDGNCANFPNDVAFTDSDSSTQIYQADYPYSFPTDTGQIFTWGVKVGAITQNSTKSIYVYYGNASQTTRHAYWSRSSTFTFTDDFEAGLGNWTASGTWVQGTQQMPIDKGGLRGFTRGYFIFKNGTQYVSLSSPAANWSDFGLGWGIWRLPNKPIMSQSTGYALNDYWSVQTDVFDDKSAWCRADWNYSFGNLTITSYPATIVQYGTTLYTLYVTAGDSLHNSFGIAKSLDYGVTWTLYAGNPVIVAGQGGMPTTFSFDGTLYYDSENTRWIIYVNDYVGGTNNSYAFVNCDVDSSPSCTNADPESTYYYQGLVRHTAYMEGIQVVKNGSYYYLCGGDISSDKQMPHCVRSTNPIGTFSFSETGAGQVTLTTYDGDYQLAGVPTFFNDGVDDYMFYFGQPRSKAGMSDTALDDFTYYAKATSFPMTWAAQNLHKTAYVSSTGTPDILLKTTTNYSNVRIDFTLTQKYQTGTSNSGLVFRYQDANNYYYVQLLRPDNAIVLSKIVNGVITPYVGVAHLSFTLNPSGTFYPMRVSICGNNIKVSMSQYGTYWTDYINISDASLPTSGRIGLYANGSPTEFDDITIHPYIYPETAIIRAYAPSQSGARNDKRK